jgi:hypothetical protein
MHLSHPQAAVKTNTTPVAGAEKVRTCTSKKIILVNIYPSKNVKLVKMLYCKNVN